MCSNYEAWMASETIDGSNLIMCTPIMFVLGTKRALTRAFDLSYATYMHAYIYIQSQ